MKLTALLLSLALAVPAAPAMAFLEPPARYNKPSPYGTNVSYYPKSEMRARCIKLLRYTPPGTPAECAAVRIWAKTGKKRCFVFINERFKGTPDGDLLLRHGRAHCNGWHKSHPQ